MTTFRFRVLTTGCKLNQAETEQIRRRLLRLGGTETSSTAAGLCVVNTCAVTAKAAKKSLAILRKVVPEDGRSRLVVTGCLATAEPERILAVRPDALVVPNDRKDRWLRLQEAPVSPSAMSRSRPLLIIQTGCEGDCSFCVVSRLRGPSRSKPFPSIAAEAGHLASLGYAEVALTATDAASYRSGNLDFPSLLESLHNLGLPLRYRLPSLEPGRLDPDRLDPFGLPSVCDHFHLCVQSGDPTVLRRMNRDSDTGRMLRLARRLRALKPHAALGADLIVGFPGETEESFRRTLDLVQEMDISYLHVFPFSPRPGTLAASFDGFVSREVLTERLRHATELGDRLWERFVNSLTGRRLVFVSERERLLSSNYISALPAPGFRQPPRGRAAEATLVQKDGVCFAAAR